MSMNAVILDAGSPPECQPLTCTRPLAACPVGNQLLVEAQRELLSAAGFEPVDRPGPDACLFMKGDAWLSADGLRRLREAAAPALVVDPRGDPLAWVSETPEAPQPGARSVQDKAAFPIRYPWDLLRVNEILVGALAASRIAGLVSPSVVIEGRVLLGRGSRLLPGVYIEGHVVIGRDCKIGPNCYLRGATAIGDGCHIGQAVEIKNSIIMAGTSIGHLSYCGDSIVGEKVNFGAGTITANFRHDGASHQSCVLGELVDTSRRKFGAVVGDHVHTGIHTSIYPGRKLWPHVATRPGAVVQRDIMEPGLY